MLVRARVHHRNVACYNPFPAIQTQRHRECQARQKSVGVQLLQRPQFRGTRGLALVHGTPDELQTKGSTYALMTVKSRENLKVDGEVPQKKNFGVTVSTRAGSLWKYIKHEISVSDVCYDPWPSKNGGGRGSGRVRGNAVALLTGPPGAGKSKASAIVAPMVNACTIVLAFDPTRSTSPTPATRSPACC